jgi:diguanylate cyclase (GGDEF)-like protein/PAS domain S-box-containing protein
VHPALDKLTNLFRSNAASKQPNGHTASSEELAAQLAAIVKSSGDAIIGKDLNGTITSWNTGAEKLFGYSATQAIGRSIRFLFPPDRLDEEDVILARLAHGEEVEPFETVRLCKDGTPVQVSVTISPIRDAAGRIVGASKIARDITQRKAIEAEIRQRNRELRALNAVTTAINEQADRQTILTRALEELVALTGVDAAESHLCDPANQLVLVAQHNLPAKFLEASRAFRFPAGEGIPNRTMANRAPLFVPEIDQEPHYLRRAAARDAGFRSLLCIPILGSTDLLGTLTLYSRRLREFTEDEQMLLMIIGRELASAIERARLYEQVQHLATTDGLTGIYNRRHFFDLAERALNIAQRYGHPISIMLVDLDHFKSINDSYGHPAGDLVLRTVAEWGLQHLRRVDILGRYGGDEFTIFLPETGSAKAREAAERLRRAIADVPVETAQGPLTMTASIGVATSADNKIGLAALLNQADQAMYSAKHAGGNRVATVQV